MAENNADARPSFAVVEGNVGQVPTAASLPIPRRKKMFILVIKADATAHCVGQEVMYCSPPCPGGVRIKRPAV